MSAIHNRRLELESIINQLSGCYASPNVKTKGFTLCAESGVVWGKTKGSKKWGQASEEKIRFYVGIDFPIESFSLDYLITKIGLSERQEDEKRSGVRLIQCNDYHTVQISLYEDKLTSYSFKNPKFEDLISEISKKSSR